MDLKEGEVLANKYRIERVLGQGGMGIVVAATHLHLGERVALKFLLPEALNHPEAVERFVREARAAVRIKSEHVARVSDVGTLDNGAPYMVMEYLQGGDLAAWVQQRGALPVEQAVEFVLQACEAIAEAHALGIVHRDLKPANLFVVQRADGLLAIKVLDFGISKATGLGASNPSMTKTSTAMGSPLYMSPEQMQSAKDVDVRTDIWALGVVLYELLSAQLPFQGETMAELVLKVVTGPFTPLRSVRADIPPGLERVINRCLEKDRGQRYRTIGELAVALLEFAPRRSKSSVERISGIMQHAGMSATALELPPSSDSVAAASLGTTPGTMASWGQTAPPKQRQRRILIVAALVMMPILALGSYALTQSRGLGIHHEAASADSLAPSAKSSSLAAQVVPAATSAAALEAVPAASAAAAPIASATPEPAPSAAPAASSAPLPAHAHGAKQRPAAPSKPAAAAIAVPAAKPAPVIEAPAPAPVVKPAPAAEKNPLKMHIE